MTEVQHRKDDEITVFDSRSELANQEAADKLNPVELQLGILPKMWGYSSVGRALQSHCRGREFDSH
jgi:hypothetical protein